MLHWVSVVSLVLSALSFLLFVYFLLARRSETGSFGDAQQEGELDGIAKAAEALSKLVDSLSKAGPVALTLTSSMVFMVLSLVAARSGG